MLDPEMNGSFQINKGLRMARKLLLDIAEMGLPAGCEFLGEQRIYSYFHCLLTLIDTDSQIQSPRNTRPISFRGELSERAPPSRKCTAS